MISAPAPDRQGRVSIAESLERTTQWDRGLTFLDDALKPARMSYRELAEHARSAAVGLRRAGVRAGDRVCLLASTSWPTLITLFGLWRLGAVPVVLARRADEEGQRTEVAHRVAAAGATAVIADPELTGWLNGRLEVPVVSVRDIEGQGGAGLPPTLPGPDTPGLLQFTSGTTRSSRAVPITQAQIVGNLRRVLHMAGLAPGDTHVSWLPLYHDMGINSLAGLVASGVDVVVMATETFARRPSAWMEAISRYRAASTAAPDFAYALAARSQQLRQGPLDLSTLRVAFNGAEPITAETVERAVRSFGPAGMRPECICPTYGLAEATLAVTMADPSELVRFVEPDEVPAAEGIDRPTRLVASCGRPLPDTHIAIRDEIGAALAEGAVGEIHVRGPGVMTGYWAGAEQSPGDGHAAVVVDGWLRTGDLGFLRGGELHVCGRIKDMIIAGGRNLYPEDYEEFAERVPGIRVGNVIAFSLPDSEQMVVVAEGRGTGERLASVGRDLFHRLHVGVGHAAQEVVMVRPGTLPKTSSGKRQRRRCRDLYLAGELEALQVVR